MIKRLKKVCTITLIYLLSVVTAVPALATNAVSGSLIDARNITIAGNQVHDLSANENAQTIYGLTEGTLFIEFQGVGSGNYQSLFSVSNPSTATDAMYRHFHVYVTPSGTLGMELRNTDSEFKYTMSANNAISTSGLNRVAFKADALTNTYKLFANGELVSTLSKDNFKFLSDITGLSKISLGGTIRNESVGYPYAGTISQVNLYGSPLKDSELELMTLGASEPIVLKSNVSITSGEVYDLSSDVTPSRVFGLTEGTIFVEFSSSSSTNYQSLFSVSNPSTETGAMYRHFHVFISPDGTLGMELRNTDEVLRYDLRATDVLTHGSLNKVALKADSASKTYKLFANGEMVAEMTKEDFKFLSDISGLATISLGGTIRNQTVGYPFAGTISNLEVYDYDLSDIELTQKTSIGPLLQRTEIGITPGTPVDLSSDPSAGAVQELNEGTFIVSFTTTSTNNIQSLFSVGNSTTGNENRHFHVYITDTGLLGMELRNTDEEFKYVLNRPAAIFGKFHGESVVNTIAFKADASEQTYKLFSNGQLLATLSTDAWKFIGDITGVNNITLGATMRGGVAAYPYGGTIEGFAVYDIALSDEELIEATSSTTYGTKIFYAGDGTGANYYRIPALLTLDSGVVVSSIDARYGGTHDARSNIDIAFSRSVDGGYTWSAPTLPLVFDDYAPQAVDWPRDNVGKNVQINGSAAFIDTVLLQDRVTDRLFLFSDAYTSGKGFNNAVAGTGFKEINGNKYLQLHWHEDADGVYNYSIRDGGVIYDDRTGTPTNYTVDGDYRIKLNGEYLTQKQYSVRFVGTTLIEEKTSVDVNQCVFYKDSVFTLLPTNYLVMKYSDNDGVTWSDMIILGQFRDVTDRMVLFGPGVGTQIKNGPHAGRLLISSYNSVSGDYGYLYSDDHGDTWGFVNTDLGGSGTFAEAQIVEFPDGTLQTYMRTNVGKIGYITSTDGGMTWSSTSYVPNISVASYGTQLSVINHSSTVGGKPVILMSTPTVSNGRRAGKILVGVITDTGATGYDKYSVSWDYDYEVDLPAYGFSYSCLTELPGGLIGLLYEKYDSWSRNELHLKDIMYYDIYTLNQLTQ